MNWRDKQATLMTNKSDGAVDITQLAGAMLLTFAKTEKHRSYSDFLALLNQIANELLTAQSGMTSLVTLFNRVFFAISAETVPDAVTLVLQEVVEKCLQDIQTFRDDISRKAVALVTSQATILTHSASSTVLHTVLNANKAGRSPHVICMEGRPLFEGRKQAANLAAQGIDVTLIIDSAAYLNLRQSGLVLVGADSLTDDGVVSKIGTASLAVSAQSFGIPCYFLADTTKVWSAMAGEQPIHERAPGDVWQDAEESIRVQNNYYDVTPWSAVSGVVTERGLLTPDEIKAQCHTRLVHNSLLNIIAEVRSTII